MLKQKMQDERVLSERRKINSEVSGILMVALLCSILIQQFYFKAEFKQYAAEFFCFFGMSIYIIIRNFISGLNIFGNEKRSTSLIVINSLVTGIVVTAINGYMNYSEYYEKYNQDGIGYFIAVLAVTFISSSLLVFILLTSLNIANKKKQESIEKKLDADE